MGAVQWRGRRYHGERTAIEAVVRGYVDSWNAHDMDAMFRLFTPEASWSIWWHVLARRDQCGRRTPLPRHDLQTNTLEVRTIDTRC
jgi:hypothetical protein